MTLLPLTPSSGEKTSSEIKKRLYMLRTDMQNIITAIKQISHDHKLREARKMYQRKVKVVLIPRKTSIIEYTFEQHGVRGLVELDELPIDLIPLDRRGFSTLSSVSRIYLILNDPKRAL